MTNKQKPKSKQSFTKVCVTLVRLGQYNGFCGSFPTTLLVFYKVQSLEHEAWNLKITNMWQNLLEQPQGFGFAPNSFSHHLPSMANTFALFHEFKYSCTQHHDGDIRLCGTKILKLYSIRTSFNL